MRASLTKTFLALLLALACLLPRSHAFSMLGALDTWMTAEVGYNLADIGGPMNLGEEYRWNMPIVTYGFDESFLNYFGTRGIEEVEKAVKILNDLPPVSRMSADLNEFPMDTRRFNHRASALFIYDIKTQVLASLLESMGLAPAERYVWTLRARDAGPPVVYSVVRRNFDPVTFEPSSYVNGVLYTYQILQTYGTPTYEAVEFEVDPSVPSVTSVSSFNMWGGTVFASGFSATISPGMFFTGLTRDDVGGLRYLYRPDNYNVETLLTNVVQAGLGTQRGNYLVGADSSGKPNGWGAPAGFTNVVGGTNLVAVNTAIRGGIDKLTFVRANYDSMIGTWVTLTNIFEDKYISNYVQRSQLVQRTLAAPDILFAAQDLGVVQAVPVLYSKAMGLTSQDAINGSVALSGPGLIFPPATITFAKVGDYLVNSPGGGQADGSFGFVWGAYDGTTNEPVIFPKGASIRTLEQMVLDGSVTDATQNPWFDPGFYVTGAAGTGGTGGTGGATGGGTAGGGTTP